MPFSCYFGAELQKSAAAELLKRIKKPPPTFTPPRLAARCIFLVRLLNCHLLFSKVWLWLTLKEPMATLLLYLLGMLEALLGIVITI
jgi:hypothetical protein